MLAHRIESAAQQGPDPGHLPQPRLPRPRRLRRRRRGGRLLRQGGQGPVGRRGGACWPGCPRRRGARRRSTTSRARRRGSATSSIRCRTSGFLTRRRRRRRRGARRWCWCRATAASTNVAAPYFVETIRRYVADNYGDEELLERGLRIYTTLDMRRQRAAEAAVRNGLVDLQRRLGFDGPDRRTWTPSSATACCAAAPRPVRPDGLPARRRGAGRSPVDAGRRAARRAARSARRADRRHQAGRAPARARGQVRRRRGLRRAAQGATPRRARRAGREAAAPVPASIPTRPTRRWSTSAATASSTSRVSLGQR